MNCSPLDSQDPPVLSYDYSLLEQGDRQPESCQLHIKKIAELERKVGCLMVKLFEEMNKNNELIETAQNSASIMNLQIAALQCRQSLRETQHFISNDVLEIKKNAYAGACGGCVIGSMIYLSINDSISAPFGVAMIGACMVVGAIIGGACTPKSAPSQNTPLIR